MADVQFSTDIITAFYPASPIDHVSDMAVARTQAGAPLVATINAQGRLYLHQQAEGNATGWASADIGADAQGVTKVLRVVAGQTLAGDPLLAMVAEVGGHQAVFITKNFSAKPDPYRWSTRGAQADATITALACGAGNDGAPILAVGAALPNDQMAIYLIDTDDGGKWDDVPLPIDGRSVVDLAIGHNTGLERLDGVHAVVHAIVETRDGTRALFTISAPSFRFYTHQVPITYQPSRVATAPAVNGDTTLFVASDTVYALTPAQQLSTNAADVTAAKTAVGSTALGHDCAELAAGVRQDGSLEVWALGSDGMLWYAAEGSEGWGDLFALDRDVSRMGLWRNPASSLIDLFSVGLDATLRRRWRDPTTTIWSSEPVLTPAATGVVEATNFDVELVVRDPSGLPATQERATITASSLSVLTINGRSHFVDSGARSVQVTPDVEGRIHLVGQIDSLSLPSVRVTFASQSRAIDLHPEALLREKLGTLTAADLRAATAGDSGSNRIFSHADDGSLDVAAAAVRKLVALPRVAGTPAEGVSVGDLGPQTAVYAAQGVPLSRKLDMAAMPSGVVLGLGISGGKLQPIDPASDPMPEFASGALAGLKHDFGDVWQWLHHASDSLSRLFIKASEDGLEIVLTFEGEVLRAELTYGEQVWSVVTKILNMLGVSTPDLLQWLGRTFDWTVIEHAQIALEAMTLLALDELEATLETLSDEISTIIDKAKDQIDKGLDSAIKDHLKGQTLDSDALAGDAPAPPSDARTRWVTGLTTQSDFGDSDVPDLSFTGDGFADLLKDFGGNEADVILTAYKAVVTDIATGYQTMDYVTMVEQLLEATSHAVLDTVKNIAELIVKLIEQAIKDVRALLTAPIDLPVLTWIFENKLTDGRTLTMLSATTLMAAIPAQVTSEVLLDAPVVTEAQATAIGAATKVDDVITALRPPTLSAADDPDWVIIVNDILAVLGVGCRFFSGLAFVVKGSASAAGVPVVPKVLSGVKVAFDLTSWATASVGASAIKLYTPDKFVGVEVPMSLVGVAFPLRDGTMLVLDTLAATSLPEESALTKSISALGDTVMPLFDTAAGAAFLATSVGLATAQFVELGSVKSNPAKTTDIIIKLAQNVCYYGYRTLAGGKVIAPFTEAPQVTKEAIVIARGGFLGARLVFMVARISYAKESKIAYIDV